MFTKNELKEFIENGGATLAKNGTAAEFSRGYQVSKKDCYIFPVRYTNKILQAVNELLTDCKKSDFVGLWVDGGKIYIDISERVERLADAIALGVARDQFSIFDWCVNRCITLKD